LLDWRLFHFMFSHLRFTDVSYKIYDVADDVQAPSPKLSKSVNISQWYSLLLHTFLAQR
jgi:hypothetical protein